MVSRTPLLIMLEVYPRKMVHLVFLRTSGSSSDSSSSFPVRGSSLWSENIIDVCIGHKVIVKWCAKGMSVNATGSEISRDPARKQRKRFEKDKVS